MVDKYGVYFLGFVAGVASVVLFACAVALFWKLT